MTFPAIQTNHAKNKTSQRSESKRWFVNRANRDSSMCAPARMAVNSPSTSPGFAPQTKICGGYSGSREPRGCVKPVSVAT